LESIDFSRLQSLTVFGNCESPCDRGSWVRDRTVFGNCEFSVSESMKLLWVLDLEGASEVEYGVLKKMMKLLCRL
jgi:hypothetical protein